MREYNIDDVVLLERVYEKLKPYMTNHPDLTIYDRRPWMPTCRNACTVGAGSQSAANVNIVAIIACICGSWFQGPL